MISPKLKFWAPTAGQNIPEGWECAEGANGFTSKDTAELMATELFEDIETTTIELNAIPDEDMEEEPEDGYEVVKKHFILLKNAG